MAVADVPFGFVAVFVFGEGGFARGEGGNDILKERTFSPSKHRFAVRRLSPGLKHVICQRTQRPPVAALIMPGFLNNFRRHVVDGTAESICHIIVPNSFFTKTEIC